MKLKRLKTIGLDHPFQVWLHSTSPTGFFGQSSDNRLDVLKILINGFTCVNTTNLGSFTRSNLVQKGEIKMISSSVELTIFRTSWAFPHHSLTFFIIMEDMKTTLMWIFYPLTPVHKGRPRTQVNYFCRRQNLSDIIFYFLSFRPLFLF